MLRIAVWAEDGREIVDVLHTEPFTVSCSRSVTDSYVLLQITWTKYQKKKGPSRGDHNDLVGICFVFVVVVFSIVDWCPCKVINILDASGVYC